MGRSLFDVLPPADRTTRAPRGRLVSGSPSSVPGTPAAPTRSCCSGTTSGWPTAARRALRELPHGADPRRVGTSSSCCTGRTTSPTTSGTATTAGRTRAPGVGRAGAPRPRPTCSRGPRSWSRPTPSCWRWSERERHTAQSLAGLATTVSALSAAESRAELLRQMFRHGRRALQADVLAVALLEPGGGHLAVVDTRDEKGSEPTRRLSVHSPAPMAAAAAGSRSSRRTRRQRRRRTARGAGGVGGPPAAHRRRPLGSSRSAGSGGTSSRTTTSACWRPSPRSARRPSTGRPAGDRAAGPRHPQPGRVPAAPLLTDPPQTEHLEIAVRYRPAAREVQIGGDWYDAFLSPTGDTTLVVGDVTGHDWTAAAVAGQLRNMLRGRVRAGQPRPDQVLSALDRALSETGIADPRHGDHRPRRGAAGSPDGGRVLRWSNAGHLLLPADRPRRHGDAERTASRPWAADPTASASPPVLLEPGETVVLYTDGLIERRDGTIDEARPGCSRRPDLPGSRWEWRRDPRRMDPDLPTTSRCWPSASATRAVGMRGRSGCGLPGGGGRGGAGGARRAGGGGGPWGGGGGARGGGGGGGPRARGRSRPALRGGGGAPERGWRPARMAPARGPGPRCGKSGGRGFVGPCAGAPVRALGAGAAQGQQGVRSRPSGQHRGGGGGGGAAGRGGGLPAGAGPPTDTWGGEAYLTSAYGSPRLTRGGRTGSQATERSMTSSSAPPPGTGASRRGHRDSCSAASRAAGRGLQHLAVGAPTISRVGARPGRAPRRPGRRPPREITRVRWDGRRR